MLYACEYYKLQQANFHFQDLNVHLTWNMALNFSAIILIKGQLYLRVYMAFCDARSVIRYIMIQLLVEGHHCHESCLIRYPTHTLFQRSRVWSKAVGSAKMAATNFGVKNIVKNIIKYLLYRRKTNKQGLPYSEYSIERTVRAG